jgi:hypothetical protein
MLGAVLWRSVAWLAVGFIAAAAAEPLAAAAPGRELLRDPDFEQGFAVLAATGGGQVVGKIQSLSATNAPVWQLAQWHSRLPFIGAPLPEGDFVVSNAAKWLCLDHGPDRGPTLTLGVDSRAEYTNGLRRQATEPWVHLLVQQEIRDAPAVAGLASLRLRGELRLRAATTFRPAGHTPALHAAQFQLVLTLNNTRRGSPGFGDYLWFVAPVYDDRHEVPPPYVAQDFAVTQGKLIYNPGAAAFTSNNVRSGAWVRLDCELRPWLERALCAAWDQGYLRDSRDLADYRVAHLNVGWEVPGLNRVVMQLRGLSLRATPVEPSPSRETSGPPASPPGTPR